MKENNLENIVPQLADGVQFHSFDSNTHLVQQNHYGHQLRINEVTYRLLTLIDGRRNIAEITNIYNQDSSSSMAAEKIHGLLFEYFSKWGIVQTDNPVQKRSKDGYLMLRITLLPVTLLRYITPYFRFLFQPAFFWISIMCMSTSAFFLFYFGQISIQFTQNIAPKSMYYIYIMAAMSVIWHELGHVAACRRFGVNHGEIGFGFYLFMPVCYADVTDAWKVSPQKRIIIDFAGVFMDFVFLHLCFLGFYFFQINWLLFVCGFVLINILFNINPFFRFDGYWALSDALGIPSLRQKSMAYSRDCISFKTKFIRSRSSFFLFFYGVAVWLLLFLFLFSIVFYQTSSL